MYGELPSTPGTVTAEAPVWVEAMPEEAEATPAEVAQAVDSEAETGEGWIAEEESTPATEESLWGGSLESGSVVFEESSLSSEESTLVAGPDPEEPEINFGPLDVAGVHDPEFEQLLAGMLQLQTSDQRVVAQGR